MNPGKKATVKRQGNEVEEEKAKEIKAMERKARKITARVGKKAKTW